MRHLVLVGALAVMTSMAAAASAQEFEFGVLDANGDGALTMMEAQNGRASAFARLDANRDGYIDADERAAFAERVAARGQRRAMNADENGDGLISHGEFMDRPYRAFEHLDRNNDGVLSEAETRSLRARLQQR
ncbi:MAG: EF-hand domain-containing protein [Hyphomonadaceae bacterium]